MQVPVTKEKAFEEFLAFITKDTGIKLEDYPGCSDVYKKDRREAVVNRRRALRALHAFYRRPYGPNALYESTTNAFSGRLSFNEAGKLEYTAGQNYPTEFRLAAACVLERYLGTT